MATTLQKQLQQLAALKGPQQRYVRGRPSLLYSFQEAADVDAETLYDIALTGAPCLLQACLLNLLVGDQCARRQHPRWLRRHSRRHLALVPLAPPP